MNISKDHIIYETKNFIAEAFPKPHVSREDGGHIRITPRMRYVDRTDLPPEQAIELIRLTMIVGKAMGIALNKRGVDVGRINYQDNGNWSVFKPEGPYLHVHLYGRAKSAKVQKYGEALYSPLRTEDPDYYKNFKPLNQEDIKEIQKQIQIILKEDKYKEENWNLKT